jgi:hypothetical protein
MDARTAPSLAPHRQPAPAHHQGHRRRRAPPAAHTFIEAIFTPLGLSPGQLRRDRILDEARHTADPVHLMTVFGIGAKTAMTYVQAARRLTLLR